MSACAHDIVARMDADDIAAAAPLRGAGARWSRQGTDIVGSALLEFGSRPDDVVGRRVPPIDPERSSGYARFHQPFNHPTVVYRRSAVEAAGGYRHLALMEDYLLFAKMIGQGARAANVAEPLVLLPGRRGGLRAARRSDLAQVRVAIAAATAGAGVHESGCSSSVTWWCEAVTGSYQSGCGGRRTGCSSRARASGGVDADRADSGPPLDLCATAVGRPRALCGSDVLIRRVFDVDLVVVGTGLVRPHGRRALRQRPRVSRCWCSTVAPTSAATPTATRSRRPASRCTSTAPTCSTPPTSGCGSTSTGSPPSPATSTGSSRSTRARSTRCPSTSRRSASTSAAG